MKRTLAQVTLVAIAMLLAVGSSKKRATRDAASYKKRSKRSYDTPDPEDAGCNNEDSSRCLVLGNSYYKKGMYGEALSYFRSGCDYRNAVSCRHVGYMLKRRLGVRRRTYRLTFLALKYYIRACKYDDVISCLRAGKMLRDGADGVRRNEARALKYFRKGCSLQDSNFCRTLKKREAEERAAEERQAREQAEYRRQRAMRLAAARKKALCSGGLAAIYRKYDKVRLDPARGYAVAIFLQRTGKRFMRTFPKETRTWCLYQFAKCVGFDFRRSRWSRWCRREARRCNAKRKRYLKALYISYCTGRKVRYRTISRRQRRVRLCRRGVAAVFKVYGRNLVRNSLGLAYWSVKGLAAAAYLPGLTQKWCVPYFAQCMGRCGVKRHRWRGGCYRRSRKCLRNARICHRKFKRIMMRTYRKHCRGIR